MPQRAILGNNRVHRSRDAGDHPDRADYNACNGAEEWEPSSHLGLDSAAHYIRKPKAGPPAGVACIFFNERGGALFFLRLLWLSFYELAEKLKKHESFALLFQNQYAPIHKFE